MILGSFQVADGGYIEAVVRPSRWIVNDDSGLFLRLSNPTASWESLAVELSGLAISSVVLRPGECALKNRRGISNVVLDRIKTSQHPDMPAQMTDWMAEILASDLDMDIGPSTANSEDTDFSGLTTEHRPSGRRKLALKRSTFSVVVPIQLAAASMDDDPPNDIVTTPASAVLLSVGVLCLTLFRTRRIWRLIRSLGRHSRNDPHYRYFY
jgi:hypothetical protein